MYVYDYFVFVENFGTADSENTEVLFYVYNLCHCCDC